MQHLMEHLYAKNVGCGHADTTKWEWATNIHRDSYASHIAHHPRLVYMAAAENLSIAEARYNFITKMVQPCGKPPAKKKEELESMKE